MHSSSCARDRIDTAARAPQVPLRNLDFLATGVRSPALVFREDRSVLNSGLMVLRVTQRAEVDALWKHFRTIAGKFSRPKGGYSAPGGDGGDQEALVSFFRSPAWGGRRVYELPHGFNLFAWQANNTHEPSWCNASSLFAMHKAAHVRPDGSLRLGHERRWFSARCVRVLEGLRVDAGWRAARARFIGEHGAPEHCSDAGRRAFQERANARSVAHCRALRFPKLHTCRGGAGGG